MLQPRADDLGDGDQPFNDWLEIAAFTVAILAVIGGVSTAIHLLNQ